MRYDDDDLRSLTEAQRADLARRLTLLAPVPPSSAGEAGERRRRHFVDFLVLCCAVLVPWIAFLAFTLPMRYVAGHWTATWVGFDVVLLAGLAATAWAGWRRRQVVVVFAIVTATLLVTDAWFDVMTASGTGGILESAADAVFVELPLAGLLFWVAKRIWTITSEATRTAAGEEQPSMPFWKLPLFVVEAAVAAPPEPQEPLTETMASPPVAPLPGG
jgi:hypothetical protein